MSKETAAKKAIEEEPKAVIDGNQEAIQDLKVLETELEFDFYLLFGDNPDLASPWIKFLIVLGAFILLALFVRLVLFVVIKVIAGKTRSNLDNKIIAKIQNPVFISIIVVGISVAALLLNLSDSLMLFVNRIIKTVFFIIWMVNTISIGKMILKHIAHTDKNKKMINLQTLPIFLNLSFVLVIIVFFYIIMSNWNVDMTAFVASAGVLGIAIGFAAKDTLANLISGVLIMADQPYRIGDFVVLEAGERGEITEIGIRSTRMRTRDDVEVTVPNAIMANTMITNESGGPYEKFRISIKVGVAYGTKIEKLRKVLLAIAVASDNVCELPEPRVRLRGFGDSSLDFDLLCWVATPVLRGMVTDELNENVYKGLNKAGIEIPFQQLDLHVKSGKV